MKKRVSFHTLGCRLNQSETDSLKLNFEQNGYTVVSETEHADVCVVNTKSSTVQFIFFTEPPSYI